VGLFSGIAKVFSPVAGIILGAHDNKKAINKANAATQLGITNAKGDLNSQLAATQGRLDPFEALGTSAAGQQGDILGLHGADAQGSILDALKASPMFQALFRTGQDTVLNNASATGGLRGGNVQSSLANFGSDTLAQVIQQQLANLSPLSQQGLQATEFGGQLGAANAGQLSGLDTGSGQANAGAILNKQAVSNNMFSQLQQLVAGAASGGAGGGLSSLIGPLSSLFGGSGGGGGIFSGAGSGFGASGGALPNFPNINIALPSSSAGLPGF
jgi:hypothetical protein